MFEHEDYQLVGRKNHLKKLLFEEVADQTGKLFDPDILTVVWARRFLSIKDLNYYYTIFERIKALVPNSKIPIQNNWAGLTNIP